MLPRKSQGQGRQLISGSGTRQSFGNAENAESLGDFRYAFKLSRPPKLWLTLPLDEEESSRVEDCIQHSGILLPIHLDDRQRGSKIIVRI